MEKLRATLSDQLTVVKTFWDSQTHWTKIGIVAGASVSSLVVLGVVVNKQRERKKRLENSAQSSVNDLPSKQPNGDPWPTTIKAVTHVKYDETIENAIIFDNNWQFPTCNPNQVLIKVYSVSLNPVDWKITQGMFKAIAPKMRMPRVMGHDFSGVIVHVGSNISNNNSNNSNNSDSIRYSVGDRVVGWLSGQPDGSFAEYIATKPKLITKIDGNNSSISNDLAACFPLAGLTSYGALFEKAKLGSLMNNNSSNGGGSGKRVLILGGSSATGQIGLQLCRLLNIGVIATTSSQEELVKGLGATKVINYRNDPAWYDNLMDGSLDDENSKYDVIYDCVGSYKQYNYARKALKSNGMFVTIVGDSTDYDNKLTIMTVLKMLGGAVYRNIMYSPQKYEFYDAGQIKKSEIGIKLKELFDLIGKYNMTVQIDPETPLPATEENVYKVINKNKQHKSKGKLVLRFCE